MDMMSFSVSLQTEFITFHSNPFHCALFYFQMYQNVFNILQPNQREWTRNILSHSQTRPGLWCLMVLDRLCAVDAPAAPTHYIWAHTLKWLSRFTSHTSSSRESNMKASGFTQMHKQKKWWSPRTQITSTRSLKKTSNR